MLVEGIYKLEVKKAWTVNEDDNTNNEFVDRGISYIHLVIPVALPDGGIGKTVLKLGCDCELTLLESHKISNLPDILQPVGSQQ